MNISQETYNRIKEVVTPPEEYIQGKICDYIQLNRIDGYFLSSLDKEYAVDYLFIKDWKIFSVYRGNLIDKIIDNNIYKQITFNNLKAIWQVFNENKKEDNKYYKEKRYEFIPKLASFILQNTKNYPEKDLLELIKDVIENLKEEKHNYYLSRNCAKLLGDYVLYCKDINEDIFEYLSQQQNITDIDISLVYYDWQIAKIHKNDKLDKIFSLLQKLKPEYKVSELIEESLEKNAFHIIKYINKKFQYKFSQQELENIFNKQIVNFNKENITFMIENFQPTNMVMESYKKSCSHYANVIHKFNIENYKTNIEYLQKKVVHENLNERLPSKNIKDKVKKI